jgi:Mg-chelatase subunit ChlD
MWQRSFWNQCSVLLSAVVALTLAGVARAADEKPAASKAPRVEVVFCLDTTGSMGGLLEGAKQKIWSICNQIAGGKPSPDLKVGLVAFRDRGDEYVTRVFDLTDDLDAIHKHLKGFKAAGGGDFPESVNEALHVAVNKVSWSKDRDTLRILFLVGDAPPHMDYPDDIKYPVTCKQAAERDIIINTIQCGNHEQTLKYFRDIATKAEGKYVQIAADGGVVAVATPFDKRLGEINTELAKSTLTYGEGKGRGDSEAKKDDARRLAGAAPGVAADRAATLAKNKRVAAYDLIDNINAGKVKLEDLKKEQLPEEMQKMTPAEQKDFLAKMAKRRAELSKEALDLDKKRGDFIAQKRAENKTRSGFDGEVLEILRSQAKKHKIDYGTAPSKDEPKK